MARRIRELLLYTDDFALLPIRNPGTHRYSVTARDGRGGSASTEFVVTVLPFQEIVLHPRHGSVNGNWRIVLDPSASREVRLHHPDRNAPKVNAPLAEPTNYLATLFPADPTQTYKLWIRLKADGNSAFNDSVWFQATGAVDQAGRPYEPGTTSGLPINLEECSGCGVSGWGWENDGWGAADRNGVLLRFPQGGVQRIVIQTREDGVSIDQIVLSAERYLTARPGTAKNDTTILPITFTPD